MASSLSITTGSLSSVKNYANDTKVQDTLLLYGLCRHLWEPNNTTLTNQQKLNRVLNDIESQIIRRARNYELDQRRAALIDDVETDVNLE